MQEEICQPCGPDLYQCSAAILSPSSFSQVFSAPHLHTVSAPALPCLEKIYIFSADMHANLNRTHAHPLSPTIMASALHLCNPPTATHAHANKSRPGRCQANLNKGPWHRYTPELQLRCPRKLQIPEKWQEGMSRGRVIFWEEDAA